MDLHWYSLSAGYSLKGLLSFCPPRFSCVSNPRWRANSNHQAWSRLEQARSFEALTDSLGFSWWLYQLKPLLYFISETLAVQTTMLCPCGKYLLHSSCRCCPDIRLLSQVTATELPVQTDCSCRNPKPTSCNKRPNLFWMSTEWLLRSFDRSRCTFEISIFWIACAT